MFRTAEFELARLEHGHGGNEWHAMEEVGDAAGSDPERKWSSGRIFRCTVCADEIRVTLPDPNHVEGARTT